MAIITTGSGRQIDTETGMEVGGAPSTSGRPEKVDTGPVTASGIAKQASWGFNTGLFYLPDLAVKGIGKALGMPDDEVMTFTKIFNRGQTAPQNAVERYSKALAEGIGGGMPITGTVAWLARAKDPVRMAMAQGERALAATTRMNALRGVANDAIQFAQKSPRLAAALDVGINALHEGIRQTIDEQVDDTDPNKEAYMSIIPTASIIGVPAFLSLTPTGMVARLMGKVTGAAKEKIDALPNLDKEVYDELPKLLKAPGVNIVPRIMLARAKSKLAQTFGDVESSPEAQQALKAIEQIMADPRFANSGLSLNTAEATMDPATLRQAATVMGEMSATELQPFRERSNKNVLAFEEVLRDLSPKSQIAVGEALRAAQAERAALFTDLASAKQNLTEAEIQSAAQRLGPYNMDRVNDELRGALLANMEMDAKMRMNVLSRMGLRQAFDANGVPMSTREEGKSLFQAYDVEAAANNLLKKYSPERPSMRTQLPEPLYMLKNFIDQQSVGRARLEDQMIKQLTDQTIETQIASSNLQGLISGPKATEATADSANKALKSVRFITNLLVKSAREGKKLTAKEQAILKAEGALARTDEKGNIEFKVGVDKFTVNPKQIVDDAKLIASENTKLDMNLPEALDYLAAAARFRNDSIARYHDSLRKGTSRLTDAQRILDTGNTVFKDVEDFVLTSIPKAAKEYDAMKAVVSDYRAGFEQNLPLLISRQKADRFTLGNEQIMENAFKSAENLRQLQVALGGSPRLDEFLQKGAIDWLRRNNILKNGTVDSARLKGLLDKNKNLVEALPANVRQLLDNEVQLADDYIKRLGEIDERAALIADNELDSMLAKATRADADPTDTIMAALRDPAKMRKLVDTVGQDPDRLNALRRSVFEVATEGADKGGALLGFIKNNRPALEVLYKNSGHLADLEKLADIQRRVFALRDVTGKIPDFLSTDERMRKAFGFGLQWMTTTAREAATGRINPTTGALAFGVRLAGALETKMYKRMFQKAMEDREFANSLTNVGSQEDVRRLANNLTKIGIIPRYTMFVGPRSAAQDIREETRAPEAMAPAPAEPVSRGTARDMLRALPPAPPSRGLSPRMPAFNPQQNRPQMPQPPAPLAPIDYSALFPNDPLGKMIQQRGTPQQ